MQKHGWVLVGGTDTVSSSECATVSIIRVCSLQFIILPNEFGLELSVVDVCLSLIFDFFFLYILA